MLDRHSGCYDGWEAGVAPPARNGLKFRHDNRKLWPRYLNPDSSYESRRLARAPQRFWRNFRSLLLLRRLPHDATASYKYPPDLPAEVGLEVSQPPINPGNPG